MGSYNHADHRELLTGKSPSGFDRCVTFIADSERFCDAPLFQVPACRCRLLAILPSCAGRSPVEIEHFACRIEYAFENPFICLRKDSANDVEIDASGPGDIRLPIHTGSYDSLLFG